MQTPGYMPGVCLYLLRGELQAMFDWLQPDLRIHLFPEQVAVSYHPATGGIWNYIGIL